MIHIKWIRLLTLLFAGLIAGTFFYGTFCVLPAFYEVPSNIHLAFRTKLMQHNKVLVMLLVLCQIGFNIIYLYQVRNIRVANLLCLTACIFTVISLVITRFGSVPINMQMKTWNPSSPPPDWLLVLRKWDFYNAIRTITAIGSFILLLITNEIQNTGDNKRKYY